MYLQGDAQPLLQFILKQIAITRSDSQASTSQTLTQSTATSTDLHYPGDLNSITTPINNVLKSIPHSVMNFYTDLIAANVTLNTDVLRVSCLSMHILQQMTNTESNWSHMGLTHFSIHTHRTLEPCYSLIRISIWNHFMPFSCSPVITKRPLYANVLLRALTPRLLAHECFVLNQNKAPKPLTYAAAVSDLEPIRPNPKKTIKVQAIQPTPSHVLAVSHQLLFSRLRRKSIRNNSM